MHCVLRFPSGIYLKFVVYFRFIDLSTFLRSPPATLSVGDVLLPFPLFLLVLCEFFLLSTTVMLSSAIPFPLRASPPGFFACAPSIPVAVPTARPASLSPENPQAPFPVLLKIWILSWNILSFVVVALLFTHRRFVDCFCPHWRDLLGE